MENPSMVFAGATRAAHPFDRVSQLPEDRRLARAAHEELLPMGMPPVNLLLTGRDGVIRNILMTLLRDVDKPISSWYPGERLVLPDPRTAMLILYDVDALGHHDQLQLLEWLERGVGRTQVVSTTAAPLLPLVEAGIFSDMLYYRLNTVSVHVTA